MKIGHHGVHDLKPVPGLEEQARPALVGQERGARRRRGGVFTGRTSGCGRRNGCGGVRTTSGAIGPAGGGMDRSPSSTSSRTSSEGATSDAQPLASLLATPRDHRATVFRAHPHQEPVGPLAATVVGLKRPFHLCPPSLTCRNEGCCPPERNR